MPQSLIHKTAAGKKAGSLTYVLSDATRDRYGDIIEADGWDLRAFRANPIALFNHMTSAPIGKWSDIRVEGDQLLADLDPAKRGTSQRIDEILSLIDQNILRATSVGFRALSEPEPIDPEKPYAGRRYTHQELLETSIVSVPANPAALQVAKSLKISPQTMSLVFGKHADKGRRDTPPGAHAELQSPTKRAIMMSIPLARQIEDAQQRLNATRDALTEHAHDPDHDTDQAAVYQAEIEAHEQRLSSLERTERVLAARTQQPAQPQFQAPAVQRRPFGIPTKETTPADFLVRAMVTHVCALGNPRLFDDVLRERYPDDEGTAIITRAAIAGATTTTAGWAAELVVLAQADFLAVLVPTAVFPRLSGLGTALTFGPNAGAIKIPSRATTPSIGGSFVGEGAPIPVRRLGTQSITLYPHKVGGLSVFSREIAMYSTPAIEGLIRDNMALDTSINIDALLIDNVAVSTTRPAGLTNGVTPLTASTAHGYTAILADIQALTNPFYAVNAGRRLALLMNPMQMQQLVFAPGPSGVPFGWTQQFTERFNVIDSTAIPAGEVLMIDAADFVSVSGAPEFEVSEQATLHMEDTTPLNIGTVGTPNVVAAPTQSMFQTAQIAIRMLANVTWAMRRAGMVQFMTGVNWGP
jgi:HK97 family phage prohead protease/HK97 family phage major capsid protein